MPTEPERFTTLMFSNSDLKAALAVFIPYVLVASLLSGAVAYFARLLWPGWGMVVPIGVFCCTLAALMLVLVVGCCVCIAATDTPTPPSNN